MSYPFEIEANPGWRVALVRPTGELYFEDIVKWVPHGYSGVSVYNTCGTWNPIDELEKSFTERPGYLGIVDPNMKYLENYWEKLAIDRAKELRWIK